MPDATSMILMMVEGNILTFKGVGAMIADGNEDQRTQADSCTFGDYGATLVSKSTHTLYLYATPVP